MRRDSARGTTTRGFYIGQTPKQTKPIRSIISDVVSYGNVLGFSGTNMRYVTITKSKWFNNGVGHRPERSRQREVPAAGGERHHRQRHLLEQLRLLQGRAVQAAAAGATGDVPYPIGVGVLLFGGRNNVRTTASTATGCSARACSSSSCSRSPMHGTLVGNQITDNQFGLNGTDLNGRDLFYDGNGRTTASSGNTGVTSDAARRRQHVQAVPVHRREHVQRGLAERGRRLGDRSGPVRQLHPPRPRPAGQPQADGDLLGGRLRGLMRRVAPLLVLAFALVPAAAGTGATKVKKVGIHDNYYDPLKLKVKGARRSNGSGRATSATPTTSTSASARGASSRSRRTSSRSGYSFKRIAEEAGQVLHLLLAARRHEDDDHCGEVMTGHSY